MIKPNELRIGNYFFDEDGNEKQIGYSDLVSLELTVLHFNPIPLTPEILERCGFEKGNDNLSLKVFEGYVSILLILNTFPLVLEIDGSRMPLHRVKYLHQLQNLYFSLTGEEL